MAWSKHIWYSPIDCCWVGSSPKTGRINHAGASRNWKLEVENCSNSVTCCRTSNTKRASTWCGPQKEASFNFQDVGGHESHCKCKLNTWIAKFSLIINIYQPYHELLQKSSELTWIITLTNHFDTIWHIACNPRTGRPFHQATRFGARLLSWAQWHKFTRASPLSTRDLATGH